jgi:hypothetical protein
MKLKYRDNMTADELKKFMGEVNAFDDVLASAHEHDAKNTEPIPDGYENQSDYAGMGWIGKDGRP